MLPVVTTCLPTNSWNVTANNGVEQLSIYRVVAAVQYCRFLEALRNDNIVTAVRSWPASCLTLASCRSNGR